MDTSVRGKFTIWSRDNESSKFVSSILKLMCHQIIMSKAYATIAISRDDNDLYNSLIKQSRGSQLAIGEASSDAELHPSALDRAKIMGRTLSIAKQRLYDCSTVSRKLRTMLQSTEGNVNSLRKYSAFLMQLAAKSIPKPLHCLPLQLATDYYRLGYQDREFPNKQNFELRMGEAFCSIQVTQLTLAIRETFEEIDDALEPGLLALDFGKTNSWPFLFACAAARCSM